MVNVGERVEKREPSYTVGGNINRCNYYGEQYEVSLTKNRVSCDPAVSLLDIYLEKMKTLIQKDTCTPMCIAALFTIARTWKQSKCSLTEEWIKKMWYIYTMECYSTIKEWNNAICSNMGGPEIVFLSEVKDRYHMISLIYGILKSDTNELIYKTEIESQM